MWQGSSVQCIWKKDRGRNWQSPRGREYADIYILEGGDLSLSCGQTATQDMGRPCAGVSVSQGCLKREREQIGGACYALYAQGVLIVHAPMVIGKCLGWRST